MTVMYYEVSRKTVALKNLKIDFHRMDLFFRQLHVAIRRININSKRGHTTVKFLESYFSHCCSSSHIEKPRK